MRLAVRVCAPSLEHSRRLLTFSSLPLIARPTRRSARTRPTPRPTRPTLPSGRRLPRRPTPRSSRSPSAAPASSRRSRSFTPRRSKRVCFAASTTSSTIRWTKTWKADGATEGWTLRAGDGAVRKGVLQSFWFVVPGVLQFEPHLVVSERRAGLGFQTSLFGGMDPSRAQRLNDRVCAFHQFGFFCWVRMPFFLDLSACFAKGTVARQCLLR